MYQLRREYALVGVIALVLGGATLRADDFDAASRLDAGLLGRTGSGADGGEGGFFDSLSVGGSLDVSYSYNFNDSRTGVGGNENVVRVFDTRHNEFSLHNLIVDLKRETSDERSFGFGFTPTFGVDSSVTAGVGTGVTAGGDEDIDVLELYGAFQSAVDGFRARRDDLQGR